jgi:hypothetical protein
VKSQRLLEGIQYFLTAVQSPRRILLKMSDCEQPDPGYDPANSTVTVCYVLFDLLARIVPPDPKNNEVVTGAAAQLVMRGTSLALIDMFKVQSSRTPDEATNYFTQLLALSLGSENAKRLLNSTATVLSAIAKDQSQANSNIRAAINPSRLEDYLCLAYGGDEDSFRDFVDRKVLSAARASSCSVVYDETRDVFVKTVSPFIDSQRLAKLKAIDWLQSP